MADSDNHNLGWNSHLDNSMERTIMLIILSIAIIIIVMLLNARSTRITKDPPERRLLNTSKQKIGKHGSITRWTFGVKNPQKMVRTIILLGETGTGKSTLINAMTTYILGVERSDNICYEIVKKEERDPSESQTSQVTVYEIFGYEDVRVPFSLRIIDTPGYGDTNGERRAKKMVEDLCHLFKCEDGVHQIDAVCLVVRASQNHLTLHQRCIFDAILSLFGKDIKKNIIPILTFSGERKPAALAVIDKFSFSWSKDKKKDPAHFRFDNNPIEEDDEDTSPNYYQEAWENWKRSMQGFFKYLNNLETRSLVMTHEVLLKREELESIQDQIVQIEDLQNVIKPLQEGLEKNEKEIEEIINCDVVDKYLVERVVSKKNATYYKKCQLICQFSCNNFQDALFSHTETRFTNCALLPGEGSLSSQVTDTIRYVPSVIKGKSAYKELKEKYEELKSLKKKISEIENEKQKLILNAYDLIIRLQEIALRPESLSVLQNINFLIEKLREAKQNEKVQKLQDISRRAKKAHGIEGDEQSLLKTLSML